MCGKRRERFCTLPASDCDGAKVVSHAGLGVTLHVVIRDDAGLYDGEGGEQKSIVVQLTKLPKTFVLQRVKLYLVPRI